MNREDFIYLGSMLILTAFGSWYGKLGNVRGRKELGTAVGLFAVFLISGLHCLHCLVSFGIGAVVVNKSHPSKCHKRCFIVMFGYLLFLRTSNSVFGLPNVPSHTNMVQMILTLKLVGAAFEKNTAYEKIQRKLNSKIAHAYRHEIVLDSELQLQIIEVRELFHYCFNFVGVLAGPYYRYRTFYDYFQLPFKDNVDSKEATIGKLKCLALYIAVYVVFGSIWPIGYVKTEKFYESHSWLYRLFYTWPAFVTFRSRIYIGLVLGEMVCTSAAFGVYPEAADVAGGEGPRTADYEKYKQNPKTMYNFKTVQNMNVSNMETCVLFRNCIKEWNVCIQYWLAVYVYKRFPSRSFRTIATLLVSSFWHGLQPGYYLCILGVAFYIPIEDLYVNMIKFPAGDVRQKVADALLFASKTFALGYLGMAFYILDLQAIWRYYSSVYHFGYVFYFVVFAAGTILKEQKPEFFK